MTVEAFSRGSIAWHSRSAPSTGGGRFDEASRKEHHVRVQSRAASILLACALTIPATPVPLAFAEEEQPEPGVELNGTVESETAAGNQEESTSIAEAASGNVEGNTTPAANPVESSEVGENQAGVETGTAPSQGGEGIVASNQQSVDLVSVTHVSETGSETSNYPTMHQALDAAREGDEVKLLGNYTISDKDFSDGSSWLSYDSEWRSRYDITFDFGGFSISGCEGPNSDWKSPRLYFTSGSTVKNIKMNAYDTAGDILVRLGEDESHWVYENEAGIHLEGQGSGSQYVSIRGASITGDIVPQHDESGQLAGTRLLDLKASELDVEGTEDYKVAVAGEGTDMYAFETYGTNVCIEAGTFMVTYCYASDSRDSSGNLRTEGLRIEGGTFTGGPALPDNRGMRLFYALGNAYVDSNDSEPPHNAHIYGGTFESQVVTASPNTTSVSGGRFRFDPVDAGAERAEGADYTVEAGGSEQGNGQGGTNTGSGSEGEQGSSGNAGQGFQPGNPGSTGGAGSSTPSTSSGSLTNSSTVSGPGSAGSLSQAELEALKQEIAELKGQGESYRDVIAALQDRDAVLSAKGATKTVKLKKSVKKTLRAKRASLKVTPSESGAETSFARVSGKRITVSKDGVVTLRKGTKRGTYTAKVEVMVGASSTVVNVRFKVR